MQPMRERVVIDAGGFHQNMQLIPWLPSLVCKPFEQAGKVLPTIGKHFGLDLACCHIA